LARPEWPAKKVRKPKVPIDHILETKLPSRVRIEADMPLEYLPFAVLELKYEVGSAADSDGAAAGSAGSGSESSTFAANAAKEMEGDGGEEDKFGLGAIPKALRPLCGLVVQHPGSGPRGDVVGASVSCWVNLPTFKSNGKLFQALDKFAALIKVVVAAHSFVHPFTCCRDQGRSMSLICLFSSPNQRDAILTSPHSFFAPPPPPTTHFAIISCLLA
jgi:hypothetical protein